MLSSNLGVWEFCALSVVPGMPLFQMMEKKSLFPFPVATNPAAYFADRLCVVTLQPIHFQVIDVASPFLTSISSGLEVMSCASPSRIGCSTFPLISPPVFVVHAAYTFSLPQRKMGKYEKWACAQYSDVDPQIVRLLSVNLCRLMFGSIFHIK